MSYFTRIRVLIINFSIILATKQYNQVPNLRAVSQAAMEEAERIIEEKYVL